MHAEIAQYASDLDPRKTIQRGCGRRRPLQLGSVVRQGGRGVSWTLDSTNLVARALGHASDACCEGLGDDVRCSEECGPAGDLDEAELCRWPVELVREDAAVPLPSQKLWWLI